MCAFHVQTYYVLFSSAVITQPPRPLFTRGAAPDALTGPIGSSTSSASGWILEPLEETRPGMGRCW
jgi:hypothetical protein